MKKIIAVTCLVLILILYNYPIFDDKKITFAVIFLCFAVIVFSIAKLYSPVEKEDYDSVEKKWTDCMMMTGSFNTHTKGFILNKKI